jgi:hypothetical protein
VEIFLDKENEDTERRGRAKRRPKKKFSAGTDLIIKVLIVCAIIDIPIWAYFNLVKGVSFWEGMKQAREKIQANFRGEQEPKQLITEQPQPMKMESLPIEKTPPVIEPEKRVEYVIIREPVQQQIVPVRRIPIEQRMAKRAMYSWTNEKGKKVFSNKGFPEDGNYTDGKIEWY